MKAKILFVMAIFALFLFQCGKDNGVESTPKATIKGTITFSGTWPEAVELVRVVVSKDFPIKSFNDLKTSDVASDGAVNYSIEVEYGEVKFIGVAWKPAGGEWGLASICGVYSQDREFHTPARVLEIGRAHV